ncbi:MAG: metal-dependent hydrolase [Rhodoferax sp.]|nr:metal-dependent hydrolase [Rhodoferax sp.]
MTELAVRRLLIDLETPFPARWNGGDAFRSALFNALSMSFPAGEQFFIDSLRAGLQRLPEPQREHLAREVQGFIGQEATHRRIHTLFNENLTRLGYDNEIERRGLARREAHKDNDLRNQVAATAATEHFTAIFSDWLLRHPEVLEGAEPRLRLLWQWHCAEESEHRSTAFDMYHALGGKHVWRIRVFKYITWTFLGDVARQTVRNLHHDGSLWRWSTWRSAAKTLFARDGMIRGNYALWRAYFSPDFHPSHQDASHSQDWLQAHTADYRIVGQAAQ